MQYQSILNSIKREVISPVYLLYGEEEYLQELVVKALKETVLSSETGSFNLDELEGGKVSLSSLVDMANTLPVFAEKRLVIVKDAAYFRSRGSKEENKEGSEAENKEGSAEGSKQTEIEGKGLVSGEEKCLLKYLEDPLLSTCLVFWQKGTVDKRRKIYKAIAATGQVLEIGPLRGRDLSDWLAAEAKKMGKRMERQALEYMLINCGNQLRNLHSELEKLALYSGEEQTITLDMMQKLVTRSSEGNIFNLVDGIGLGKGEEALLELKNLLINGEPPVKILHMIARQFRLLLLVKEAAQKGWPEKKISAELSLHPFVTGKILRQARNFSFAQLEKSLQLILQSDLGIKTGLKPDLTLETLIIKLTSTASF